MSLIRQVILVAVTAIFVSILPSLFKTSYPVPEIFGTVAPGFEDVREVFRENFELGWDKNEGGSAFAVYYKGEKVVDIWAGFADQEAKMLWKENTMSVLYSTTKGLCALCIAILADRELIDFKKPVSDYWPEFAQNGKEKVTVEMLMEHEAGLPILSQPMTFDLLQDHDALDKVLAETKPLWEPGTAHGYHTISIGFYVDALIRRVDPEGRTVGKFFSDEVAKPFGIDAFIGTPREEMLRVGRLVYVQPSTFDIIHGLLTSSVYRSMFYGYIMGGAKLFVGTVSNCGQVCEIERRMDPEVNQIVIPSICGVATARGIAKLFGILANGGKLGNKTLLSQRIIMDYVNDKRERTGDLVLFGLPMKWKYGMDIIPQPGNAGNLFGSSGAGGQIGYSDVDNKIGYGFVTRYSAVLGIQFYDPRIARLQESVLRVVTKVEK